MMLDRSKAPEIKDFVKLHLPECELIVLDNGVKVHVIRTESVPANQISILWNYGTNRCPGKYGSSFVPAMLMQGTKTLSGEEIVDRLDFYGTFSSYKVGSSYTQIEWMSLNDFTPQILETFEDILLKPDFPADRFMALKRKSIMQFDLNQTRTKFRAGQRLKEVMSGEGHPYIRSHTRDDIEKLTLEEVIRFREEGFFKTDIDIFISGVVSDEVLQRVIEFAKTIRKEKIETTKALVVRYKPEAPGRYFVEMPNARQASIAIGIPAIDRSHPDYIPLRIAVVALGGYFGSRLMSTIREEKGLTYGINAALLGAPEGGSINIEAECDRKYVDEVLDSINIELRKMAETPMADDELLRLKSFYRTVIASTLESFKTIGDFYESELIVGFGKDYFSKQQEILSSVSSEEIRRIAAKYFRIDEQRIVIAGTKA